MPDLVSQNYNNKCLGWVKPSNLFFGPEITGLTGFQSPAGSNTVVTIIGTNFYSYSVIRFGTFTPTTFFINSTLISFYVPSTLSSGTYPVQVYNGSVGSNIVNYTIDMSSGYWMLNVDSNTGTISNTNSNGVQVSWLSRNGITLVSNTGISPGSYGTNETPFYITDKMNWIKCDGGINKNNIFLSLPFGTNYIGRELTIKSISGDVYSQLSDIIIPFLGNGYQSLITQEGNSVTLINVDGRNWEIMQQNS